MYHYQVINLRKDIIKNGGYEACTIHGESKGINIVGVRKLPQDINGGNHHAFIDLIDKLGDYRGKDYKCVLNGYKSYTFDKPLNEVGCHIDLWNTNNKLQIKGLDGSYSQVLENLSFAHTVWGHSSYYIYAELVTEEPSQPSNPDLKDLSLQIENSLSNISYYLEQASDILEQIKKGIG